jgi:hypothetical protein
LEEINFDRGALAVLEDITGLKEELEGWRKWHAEKTSAVRAQSKSEEQGKSQSVGRVRKVHGTQARKKIMSKKLKIVELGKATRFRPGQSGNPRGRPKKIGMINPVEAQNELERTFRVVGEQLDPERRSFINRVCIPVIKKTIEKLHP